MKEREREKQKSGIEKKKRENRLRLVFLHRTVQSSWKGVGGRSMTNFIVAILPIRCVLGFLLRR